MILDSIKNGPKYESVHPRFKKAFEFLLNTDLASLPVGKIELEGKSLFVNVAEVTGKTDDEAKMETHNRYIDIQVPISGVETMGWKAGSDLQEPLDNYNPDKDITFFADKATSYVHVQTDQFVIFFPEDGHQPGLLQGKHMKIIVKIEV